jgi:hypothetical protein|nr:MAG TPA: hypothetical protein [Caudoviricetes sp.]
MTHAELVKFMKAARLTADDQTALVGKDLYPLFADIVGTTQKKGFRCRYEVNGQMSLYKLSCDDQTAEGTQIQENWNPVDAQAIWTAIDIEHTGTIDDPIPAAAGMEYVKGKYYLDNGMKYLMNRAGMQDGESIVLQYLPSQLVGQYFELA